MDDETLCKWLRENSSGTYRPSALAADRLERLIEENKKLTFMIENGIGFEDLQQDSMQSHIN